MFLKCPHVVASQACFQNFRTKSDKVSIPVPYCLHFFYSLCTNKEALQQASHHIAPVQCEPFSPLDDQATIITIPPSSQPISFFLTPPQCSRCSTTSTLQRCWSKTWAYPYSRSKKLPVENNSTRLTPNTSTENHSQKNHNASSLTNSSLFNQEPWQKKKVQSFATGE